MAAIGKFEDIEAWQGARALVKALYEVTGQGAFARDLALRDQLRRAAVSVMSNIAEGFERDGDREFRQFLTIAKASAGEVRSLLYVALDLEYINGAKHDSLSDQARVLSRQIARFIIYLNRRSQQPNGRSLAPLPDHK